jgi:hypothetical protein
MVGMHPYSSPSSPLYFSALFWTPGEVADHISHPRWLENIRSGPNGASLYFDGTGKTRLVSIDWAVLSSVNARNTSFYANIITVVFQRFRKFGVQKWVELNTAQRAVLALSFKQKSFVPTFHLPTPSSKTWIISSTDTFSDPLWTGLNPEWPFPGLHRPHFLRPWFLTPPFWKFLNAKRSTDSECVECPWACRTNVKLYQADMFCSNFHLPTKGSVNLLFPGAEILPDPIRDAIQPEWAILGLHRRRPWFWPPWFGQFFASNGFRI